MAIKRKHYCKRALALAGVCSFAQVYADDAYLDMDIEQLLQVPVTGATLRNETLKTVPSAVTVFTRKDIERLGVDYLYELLNLVPGFQFDRAGDSPAGYTFSVRGRRTGTEARQVLLLVDGRVFSDSRTDGANRAQPLFPLEQIERVEIIRGPGSALYGSNAVNGVINIVSRQGENNVTLSAGSQSRTNATLLASHNSGEWHSNFFAKVYQDHGQSYELNNNTLNTTDPRKTYDMDLAVSHGDTTLRAAYHRMDAQDFYVVEAVRNNFNSYMQEFRQISVEQNFINTDKFKSKLSISYSDSTRDFSFMGLPEGSLLGISNPKSNDPLLINLIVTGRVSSVLLANDFNVDEVSSVQFGAQWRQNKETRAEEYNNFDLGQLSARIFPVNYYGDFSHTTQAGSLGERISEGVYAQYLRNLTQSLHLTLSVRDDYYVDVGNHLSPRFGLVDELSDTQTVKLLFGEAYRAASLNETGLKNSPVLVGNPDLTYEIVKTWDAIWLINSGWGLFSIDYFDNEYKNSIVAGRQGTTQLFVNGGDERSNGVEIESNWQLSRAFNLRATYTQFLSLPQSAFREAEHLSSVTANYEQGKWNFNLSGFYQSQRQQIVSATQPRYLSGFWVLNTKLRYAIAENFTLSFQAKNLLDKQYSTPTEGTGIPTGIPNRGRELSVAFEFPF